MYFLCSENKSADQLAAFVFRYAKSGFYHLQPFYIYENKMAIINKMTIISPLIKHVEIINLLLYNCAFKIIQLK